AVAAGSHQLPDVKLGRAVRWCSAHRRGIDLGRGGAVELGQAEVADLEGAPAPSKSKVVLLGRTRILAKPEDVLRLQITLTTMARRCPGHFLVEVGCLDGA